ncbi:MAG: Holliday junction branch migration protein RuvA [Acidobacteria bacterium]|nr:Holliday junction branch migration protein RuvA [Acidobacteriota bacterium]
MIAQLTGKLLSKKPSSVIIDVHGVGYEVAIPLSTFYTLGDEGSSVSLKVHTHVREDAITLIGFHSQLEKELFLKLINVSGVGPKLGLLILSGMEPEQLVRAIRRSDLGRLTGIPGVGKKTGERIVVELRDKMVKLAVPEEEGAVPPLSEKDQVSEDVISALVNLGYQRAPAEKAVQEAARDGASREVQELLKRSLRHLAK